MSQILATSQGGGGGGGALNTLTGSVGAAVGPNLAGDIKLLAGTNMGTLGTPGLNKIVFSVVDAPTFAGAVTALTLATSDAAAHLSITADTVTAAGTDVNIGMNFITKGSGVYYINTPNGSMVYRGIQAGYTSSEWHTLQTAIQTLNGVATNILAIPLTNNQMVSVKALINGFQSDYTDCVAGEILVTAYRAAAGNIVLVGSPIINVNYTDLIDTSDIDAGINVGTQSLELKVLGVAAQTWNWVATIQYMFTISNA